MSSFLQRFFNLCCNWIGGLSIDKLEGYTGIMPIPHLRPVQFLPYVTEVAKLLQLQDLGSFTVLMTGEAKST